MADYWEKTLGGRIRSFRQALGWTQGDLAKQMTDSGWTMHQSTITKIESGGRPTSVGEVAALAALFDIPVAGFFESDEQVVAHIAMAKLSARVQRLTSEMAQLASQEAQVGAELEEAEAQFLALLDKVAVVPPPGKPKRKTSSVPHGPADQEVEHEQA